MEDIVLKFKTELTPDKLIEDNKGKNKITISNLTLKYTVFLCSDNTIYHQKCFDTIDEAKNYSLKIYSQYNNCSPYIATSKDKGYYPEVSDEIINMNYIENIDFDFDDIAFIFIFNNKKQKFEDKYDNFVF